EILRWVIVQEALRTLLQRARTEILVERRLWRNRTVMLDKRGIEPLDVLPLQGVQERIPGRLHRAALLRAAAPESRGKRGGRGGAGADNRRHRGDACGLRRDDGCFARRDRRASPDFLERR